MIPFHPAVHSGLTTMSGRLFIFAVVVCVALLSIPQRLCADLVEGFDSVLPAGWSQQNLSTPVGSNPNWFQGNTGVFSSQSGSANSYIAANFNSVAGANIISNWLFTPQLVLSNGDVVSFWTRTVDVPFFPDRLQLRLSTNGASTNVGATNTSVGDFTTLLLDINPGYSTSGYPNVWTNFSVTISGLSGPSNGRLAFRYFVEDGGPAGNNSDYIGIDTFSFTQAIPEPATASLFVIGIAGAFVSRRRR